MRCVLHRRLDASPRFATRSDVEEFSSFEEEGVTLKLGLRLVRIRVLGDAGGTGGDID